MKTTLRIAVVTLTALLAGCSTCGQGMTSWFHRGDRCNVCPPPDCPPGMPRTTMMLPGSPQVLPGPIEVAPSP